MAKALQTIPVKIVVSDRPRSNYFIKRASIGETLEPLTGYEWEVLAACVNHVNGNKSLFTVKTIDTLYRPGFYWEEPAATASGYVAVDLSKAKQIILIKNKINLQVGGGVGASWGVLIKETKIF